jgi:hypothetical protein
LLAVAVLEMMLQTLFTLVTPGLETVHRQHRSQLLVPLTAEVAAAAAPQQHQSQPTIRALTAVQVMQ